MTFKSNLECYHQYMSLPEVKFCNIPLPTEIDWMHGFLFKNKWGWQRYIIKKHPEIKKVFSCKNEEEQVKFLRRYIVEFQKIILKL